MAQPLSVSEAEAAVDVALGYGNKYYSSSLYAYVVFRGVKKYYSYYYWYCMHLTQHGNFAPYAYIYFKAPTTGWYTINVRAWGTKAYIRHLGATVANWNFSSYNWNDFVTMQYLEAGFHCFWWYPDQTSVYVKSVKIASY